MPRIQKKAHRAPAKTRSNNTRPTPSGMGIGPKRNTDAGDLRSSKTTSKTMRMIYVRKGGDRLRSTRTSQLAAMCGISPWSRSISRSVTAMTLCAAEGKSLLIGVPTPDGKLPRACMILRCVSASAAMSIKPCGAGILLRTSPGIPV